MSLLDQLTVELKTAMKSGEARRRDALRLLISALKYKIVDLPDLDEKGMVEVLQKEAKKRRESIEAYRQGGREEQAQAEEYELAVIEEYLPRMKGEEEIRNIVSRISNIEEMNFGEVMQLAMKQLKGRAEGAVVAKVVKEVLSHD